MRRLNYANVTATLALFFAMSGGALAAKRYLINSTKQLNPKVLKALKGNRGPAGPIGKEGPPGKEGSAGKEGKEGTEGPQGKAGATNAVMRIGSTFAVARNGFAKGTANCKAGERVTGGGVFPVNNVFFPNVVSSFPLPNEAGATAENGVTPTGWEVWVSDPDAGGFTAPTVEMTPYVICVSP